MKVEKAIEIANELMPHIEAIRDILGNMPYSFDNGNGIKEGEPDYFAFRFADMRLGLCGGKVYIRKQGLLRNIVLIDEYKKERLSLGGQRSSLTNTNG